MAWTKVASIYDGDTVSLIFHHDAKLTKFRCRLAHIDAPEKRSDDPEEVSLAEKALSRLKELIGPDAIVYAKFSNFDKYGRLLVELYGNSSDEKSINQILVDERLAYSYEGGTKKPFREWVSSESIRRTLAEL